MRRPALALTVIGLLALTGCGTAEPEPTPTVTVGPATPAETPAAEPTVTPGPVQVTPQAETTPADPTEGMTAEQRYVYYADEWLRGWNVHLSEADLLSAGWYACEQFAAGVPMSDIVALEGVGSAVNEDVLMAADEYLCG